jgi:5-methylcytosine-specific restriction endonuclease McrA
VYITKNCEVCTTEFQADKREHNRGNGRFCSLKCSASRSRKPKGETVICFREGCNNSFYRSPHKLKKAISKQYYCSNECKSSEQRIGGKLKPLHYGEGIGRKSYRTKAFAAYPVECLDCGYKKHTNILHVHHLDGDRRNAAVENLIILCPTCHEERHAGHRPNVGYSDDGDVDIVWKGGVLLAHKM